jgi:hypothetical protein
MDDSSLATIPLFSDSEFYLPLKVAQQFKFPLSHHIIDGKFWGSIQDWLTGLVGNPTNAQKTWTKFQTAGVFAQLSTSGRQFFQPLPYTLPDGRTYQTDHGCEVLLYHLAQYVRSTKTRPQVAAVKAYLAESGVIVGDMIRDPEGMALKLLDVPDNASTRKEIKDVHRTLDSGYSYEEGKQWHAMREALKDANNRVRAARQQTELVAGHHWAALGLEDFRFAFGMTQDEWREINGMVDNISDYLSTVDLFVMTYLKETIADKMAECPPRTYSELYAMISSVTELPRIRRIFSKTAPERVLKTGPKPKQIKVDDNDSEARK